MFQQTAFVFVSEISNGKGFQRNARAFVMRISDDEMEDDFQSKREEVRDRSLVAVKRFSCDELYLKYTFMCTCLTINYCIQFNVSLMW